MNIRINNIVPTPLERAAGRLMRALDHPGQENGEDDHEELDETDEDEDTDEQSGQSGDDESDQEDDDEQSDSSDDGDSGGKRKPDRNGYEKRIARLTRRTKELQERLAASENEKREKAPKTPSGGKPKVDDFEVYEDFIEALADYKAEEKLKGFKEQTQHQNADIEFLKRLKEGKKSFKDWNDIVTDDVEVSPAMQRAIKDSDYPAEILYYLGKHPNEAEDILEMPASKQVLAIGKIEGRIEAKSGKSNGNTGKRTTTAAPDPIRPSSGSGKIKKGYDEMSFAEFTAARKRETYGARN